MFHEVFITVAQVFEYLCDHNIVLLGGMDICTIAVRALHAQSTDRENGSFRETGERKPKQPNRSVKSKSGREQILGLVSNGRYFCRLGMLVNHVSHVDTFTQLP